MNRRSSKRSSSARRHYRTTTTITSVVIRILIAIMEVVKVTTMAVMMKTMTMSRVQMKERRDLIWRES